MRCSQLLAQGSGVAEAPIYSDEHNAGEALPLPVRFSSSSSTDPNNQPLTYRWTFGDGEASTTANPLHLSGTTGTFTAVLTVADSPNATNSDQVAITADSRTPVATIITPVT
ncbi:MAG: PKD domain-containing protein [Nitrospirota bacterium]